MLSRLVPSVYAIIALASKRGVFAMRCADSRIFYHNNIYTSHAKCKNFATTIYRCNLTDNYGRQVKRECPVSCGMCKELAEENDKASNHHGGLRTDMPPIERNSEKPSYSPSLIQGKSSSEKKEPLLVPPLSLSENGATNQHSNKVVTATKPSNYHRGFRTGRPSIEQNSEKPSYLPSLIQGESTSGRCVDSSIFYYNKIYTSDKKCKKFATTIYRCNLTDNYGREVKHQCPVSCGMCKKTVEKKDNARSSHGGLRTDRPSIERNSEKPSYSPLSLIQDKSSSERKKTLVPSLSLSKNGDTNQIERNSEKPSYSPSSLIQGESSSERKKTQVPSLSLSENGATNQHSNKVITKDHLVLANISNNGAHITFDKAMNVKTAKALIVHLLNYVYLEIMTNSPSMQPSYIASEAPSFFPTNNPTIRSSKSPTKLHSIQPSWVPSYLPSQIPSLVPSLNPSNPLSMFPSSHLSDAPSSFPSSFPSEFNRMKYCVDDPYYSYNKIESKEFQCKIFAISEYRCKIIDVFGQHVGSRCPEACGLCEKLLKANDSTAGLLREKTGEPTLEPTGTPITNVLPSPALTLRSNTISTFNRVHECVDDENFYFNKIFVPENKCKSFAITNYRCKSTDRFGRKIKEKCPATCGICAKKLIRDGSSVEPVDDTVSERIPPSMSSMQSMIPSTVPSNFQSTLLSSQAKTEKICMDNPDYHFHIFKNDYECKEFATSVFRCNLIDTNGKKVSEECPSSCGLCDKVSFEKSSIDEHGFGNF